MVQVVHIAVESVCSKCFTMIPAWRHAQLTHEGGGRYSLTHTTCPDRNELLTADFLEDPR